jgi:hypothetical protein
MSNHATNTQDGKTSFPCERMMKITIDRYLENERWLKRSENGEYHLYLTVT